MTLLDRRDGDGHAQGASYLELAELIARDGSTTDADLEELWRRIVFFMCISNVDDHLRNHGFLLEPGGWALWLPELTINPTGDVRSVGLGIGFNVNRLLKVGVGRLWTRHTTLDGQSVGDRLDTAGDLRTKTVYTFSPSWQGLYFGLSVAGWPPFTSK